MRALKRLYEPQRCSMIRRQRDIVMLLLFWSYKSLFLMLSLKPSLHCNQGSSQLLNGQQKDIGIVMPIC